MLTHALRAGKLRPFFSSTEVLFHGYFSGAAVTAYSAVLDREAERVRPLARRIAAAGPEPKGIILDYSISLKSTTVK